MEEFKVAVFELNGDTLGTDALLIQEIVKYEKIKVVEDVPDYVEGFFDYRGKVIPIINLNSKFNFGETKVTKKTKIIITLVKEEYIGFVVNDVSSILNTYENELEDMPKLAHKSNSSYLKKVVKKGKDVIAMLDITLILNEKELKQVKTIKNRITRKKRTKNKAKTV
jgi:purine-binding chemotaxis protein CheW